MTRIIVVGGFLGAGKTTLLLHVARELVKQGKRVGLITNDQGENLVDTALVVQSEIPVTEVAGGCFCCRFPDLMKALDQLQQTVKPDIVLAEPVGSCTDLVATVLRPLTRYAAHQFQVAPLTILLDAQRDLTEFSPDVAYLYQQQLAEADLLVLNKADVLTPEQLAHQQAELQLLAPQSRLLTMSAHTGTGVAEWLQTTLTAENDHDHVLADLDYGRYAKAEAELGWLNARGVLLASQPFQISDWATSLLNHLAGIWRQQSAAIAHVKLNLQTETSNCKVSLTQQGGPIIWDKEAAETTTEVVEFILNARISSPPDVLAQTIRQAMDAVKPAADCRYEFAHFECFSPAPPQPTYQMR